MKTIKKLFVLMLGVALISLTGCSNDDSTDGGGGSAASGTLTAKVGGVTYQSLEISSSATVANSGQNLIIIATNSDGNAFNMSVFGYSGPGTYKLTGADPLITNTASYTETDVDLSNPQNSTTEIWQAPYDSSEVGEIVVTEETNDKIKGTFSFTCKNVNGDNSVKNVTNGAFNLNKQTI